MGRSRSRTVSHVDARRREGRGEPLVPPDGKGRRQTYGLVAVIVLVVAVVGGAALLRGGVLPAPEAPLPELQTVTLPDLSPLDAAAREQIEAAHTRLTELSGFAVPDRTALGAAQGELGTLLLAYDQPGAEAALANAEALQPLEPRWPYYLGLAARLAGDFETALQAYDRAWKLAPDDVAVRFRVAQMYHELGRNDEATRVLESLVANAPSTALAHHLLGQIAADRGDHAAAITHFETTLALQPKASAVHSPLALAYEKTGDMEKNRQHLAQIGTVRPTIDDPLQYALEALKVGPNAWVTQANHALDTGDPVAAANLSAKALEQDPRNVRALLYLGDARVELGDPAGAIEAYQQAADLDPTNPAIHQELGQLLGEAGQVDAAEAAYLRAIALDARLPEAQLGLAELLRRTGRCEEALPNYMSALEGGSPSTAVQVQKVFCLVTLGRYAEARADVEAALASKPGDLDLMDALARLLASAPDEGLRDGLQALALARVLLQQRQGPDALETEAMAHAAAGDFDTAVRRQEAAIEIAEKEGQSAWLEALRGNLERYRQREIAAAPWPAFVLAPAPPGTP